MQCFCYEIHNYKGVSREEVSGYHPKTFRPRTEVCGKTTSIFRFGVLTLSLITRRPEDDPTENNIV